MRAEGLIVMNAEGITLVADRIFITENRINIRAGGISMGRGRSRSRMDLHYIRRDRHGSKM